MPAAAAVPPSPAQNATEDSNTSRLLQAIANNLDRTIETLDTTVTTAQANTVAISHLASYFRRMMSWVNNVEQRVDALSRNQKRSFKRMLR